MSKRTIDGPKVWDKAKWHTDAASAMNRKQAGWHISVMLRWLRKKGLTTPEGDDEANGIAGADQAISSDMVTVEGAAFLDRFYDRWLETVTNKPTHGTSKLESYWRDFQVNLKKTKRAAPQVDRLLANLQRKAKRNEVEVEDLLKVAVRRQESDIARFEDIKTNHFTRKKGQPGDALMAAWVDVIILLLGDGPEAVADLALDRTQSERTRDIASAVLAELKSTDSLRAALRASTALMSRFDEDYKAAFQIGDSLSTLLETVADYRLSKDEERLAREFAHALLGRARTDVDAVTAYCILKIVGNHESAQNRPPLKNPWKGVEKKFLQAIRARHA